MHRTEVILADKTIMQI